MAVLGDQMTCLDGSVFSEVGCLKFSIATWSFPLL